MYDKYLKMTNSKNGLGTFTTVQIPANVPIMEIRGPLYSEKNLPDPDRTLYLQVGPDTFLGPSGGFDDHINHSCNPNCMVHVVGNRAILYSLYLILEGSELTFDWSLTSTDSLDKWKMDCQCGDFNCRKVVSGFQYLNPQTQSKMKDKGLVPLYIVHPNMFTKTW